MKPMRATNLFWAVGFDLVLPESCNSFSVSNTSHLGEKLQTKWEPEFIFTMIWLTIGVSLAAYAFMWRLVERMDATRVASLFYLGPPVTMLMAWIAFGDTLQIMDIAGLTVVVTGIVLTHLTFQRNT